MGLEDKDEKVAKMLATIGTLEKDDLISLINHYETVWDLTEDKGSINVQHMVGFNEGQFFDEADVDKTTVPPLPKKIDMRVVEDKSNRLFLMFQRVAFFLLTFECELFEQTRPNPVRTAWHENEGRAMRSVDTRATKSPRVRGSL